MPIASTIAELVTGATDRLAAAGVDSPRLDAELLLAQALGVERTGLLTYPHAPVGEGARETFEASIARRERGEPVAYIRGFREFHGLAFVTDARALIPRPETELLVDAAIEEIASRLAGTPRAPGVPALRVADVGTGTGAIAVALLSSLRRRKMADEVLVIAIDVSEEALQLARENAVGHGVADRVVFMAADLLPYHVDPPYTVVCANLPYVATDEIPALARELTFEPALALDGGPDGLDVVRRLLDALPRTLAPDGVAFLEIGAGHGEAIAHEVAERLPGWRCRVTADLAGLPRLARVEPTDPGTPRHGA